MDLKERYIVCTVGGCEMYGTNYNRTHLDTDRTLESQSLLFLFVRSYTRRHENDIIEVQFIWNLEDSRTNDGLLQEGCRTRQSVTPQKKIQQSSRELPHCNTRT